MAVTEDQIKAARARVNAATTTRARAQAEHDHASAAQATALQGLKDYGVSTPQEAAALLKALDAELQESIDEISSALAEAGA